MAALFIHHDRVPPILVMSMIVMKKGSHTGERKKDMSAKLKRSDISRKMENKY